MNDIKRVIRWISIALLVAAIIQELRKPAAERTWHGLIFGFVPYDLRPPTPSRVMSRLWNPDQPDILTATPFGVGWSLNFNALTNLLLRTLGAA